MADEARVSAAQLLVEWVPTPEGRVSNERLLAEWAPQQEARISAEQLLAEWIPSPPPFIVQELALQGLIEWTPQSAARLDALSGLIDWTPASRARLFDLLGLVEWSKSGGNVITLEGGVLILSASDGAVAWGIEHRLLADLALAELDQGGVRGTQGPGTPNGGGDGFPLSGRPPVDAPGLARYPEPDHDPTWGP